MTEDTLIISLDGQAYNVPPDTTLAALIDSLGHAAQSISTAVNAEFVPRAQRTQRVLQAHDRVLLFQPIVGG
jgi:sulfur carrier protein